MTQFLELMNKLKDMQIVRFFSQFFTEDKLSPMVSQLKQRVDSGTGGGLAKELVVWAIILAVGAFIIDQVFYWTNPGQIEQARGAWRNFAGGVASLGQNARYLVERAKGIGHKQELPRGHR